MVRRICTLIFFFSNIFSFFKILTAKLHHVFSVNNVKPRVINFSNATTYSCFISTILFRLKILDVFLSKIISEQLTRNNNNNNIENESF